jgi:hypothetical protein
MVVIRRRHTVFFVRQEADRRKAVQSAQTCSQSTIGPIADVAANAEDDSSPAGSELAAALRLMAGLFLAKSTLAAAAWRGSGSGGQQLGECVEAALPLTDLFTQM